MIGLRDASNETPERRLRWLSMVTIRAPDLLVGYLFFLLLIPSPLIVAQIGAAGTPANLLAWIGLLWWVGAHAAGLTDRRRPIVFATLILFSSVVVASYASAMAKGWYAPPDVRQSTDAAISLADLQPFSVREVMLNAADRGLLTLAAWASLMLMAMFGLRSLHDINRVVKWFVTLVSVVAGIGIVQYFVGFDLGFLQIPGLVANSELTTPYLRDFSSVQRVASTSAHPIEFGVLVAAAWPLALHRALHSSTRWSGWIPVVVIGAAIPLSVSRSAIIVLAVAMCVLIVSWPRQWRRRALFAIPVVLAIYRVAVPGVLGTLKGAFTNVAIDPSVAGRTADYEVALRFFGHDPLLGRGMSTFVATHYRTFDNQYLLTLVDTGLLGLTALVALLLSGFFAGRRASRGSSDLAVRHLAIACSASIAGLAASFAFFDALSFPQAAGTTFFLVGLAGALVTLEDPPLHQHPTRYPRGSRYDRSDVCVRASAP